MRLYQLFSTILMESACQSSQAQQNSRPANIIATQIIKKLFICSSAELDDLQQLCSELKNKKHPNHQKFSQHIASELLIINNTNILNKQSEQMQKLPADKIQFAYQYDKVMKAMISLGKVMQTVGNGQHQIKSVAIGFKRYWMSVLSSDKSNQLQQIRDKKLDTTKKSQACWQKQLKNNIVKFVTKSYFRFNENMSETLMKLLIQLLTGYPNTQIQAIRKQLCQQILDNMQIINQKISLKSCYAIHYLVLQEMLPKRTVPFMVLAGNIQKTYIALLQEQSMLPIHHLVEEIISKMLSESNANTVIQQIKKIVSLLKIDAHRYPLYIRQLNKRCLLHFFSTQQIFFTQLKIQDRPDILNLLVELLIDRQRFEQAKHFINKYHLKQFYNFTDQNKKYLKNILVIRDAFWPTQPLLRQSKKSQLNDQGYLTLHRFGYKLDDVHIIDDSNISLSEKCLLHIKSSVVLGIDTQNVPVFNAYEKRQTALLQIATQTDVIIFDILSLKNKPNQIFYEWLLWLMRQYTGKIIGVALEGELHELFKQVTQNLQNTISKVQSNHQSHNTQLLVNKQQNSRQIFQQINTLNLKSLNDIQIAPEMVDISKFYKIKNPTDPKSSLQHMCNQVLNAKLSKYEQCSGWQIRPLRKAQIHYAALDAVLPMLIYDRLRK